MRRFATELLAEVSSSRRELIDAIGLEISNVGMLSAEEIKSGGLESLIKLATPELSRVLSKDIFDTQSYILNRYAKIYFKEVGSGSSRTAYIVDTDHAIKVAYNSKGQAQNKVESHIAQKFHNLPITHVHYMSPQGVFLLVDFAHELDESHFETTYGMPFEDFSEFCHNFHRASDKNAQHALWEDLPKQAKTLVVSLVRHGILLADLQGEDQWGDFNNHPVIVD